MLDHSAARFLIVQTQWAVEINMPRGSAKLAGCVWVNRILIYEYNILLSLGFHRSTRLITLTYLCLSSTKSFFLHPSAIPAVMTFFSVQKSTEVSFYFLAPWFLARESRVFDWANRHVPRKNAIERIESTIGKSHLDEKAWCLNIALRSLLVMSNLEALEASRYCSEHNWCEDMVHTWTTLFVCRKQVMSTASLKHGVGTVCWAVNSWSTTRHVPVGCSKAVAKAHPGRPFVPAKAIVSVFCSNFVDQLGSNENTRKFRVFKGCLVTLKFSCLHGPFALLRGCRYVVLMRSFMQRCRFLPKMALFLPYERKTLQIRPFSNWFYSARIGGLPTWISHWISPAWISHDISVTRNFKWLLEVEKHTLAKTNMLSFRQAMCKTIMASPCHQFRPPWSMRHGYFAKLTCPSAVWEEKTAPSVVMQLLSAGTWKCHFGKGEKTFSKLAPPVFVLPAVCFFGVLYRLEMIPARITWKLRPGGPSQ